MQFKSKIDGSSLHFIERNGEHFVKRTQKSQHLKKAPTIAGPFKTEGDALVAISMSKVIGFNNFRQIYPASSSEAAK